MSRLELKVPPLALAIVLAMAMWLMADLPPPLPYIEVAGRVVAACLALSGIASIVAGAAQFRKASTTVNPTRPDSATTLVSGGIYRYSRNPMYLGIALMMLGWAIWLGSSYGLIPPAVFVLYLNRFQIRPEEEALRARFGAEYLAYKRAVRRWL